ncbi:MAG: SCO family protein [Stagnimonas sp.]|nr:SCO family protein [Stagnimonas sp.]
MIRGLWSLLLALGLVSVAAGAELPGDSLYQLEIGLVSQDGQPRTLALYRGQPTMISMFYGSCPRVCPLLIANIRRMEQQLPERERGRLRVLLVSLDPDRDSPDKLLELARRHQVDLARWTLARAEAADVRKLAAALGIRYRQLPDGEFNHSTVISLLDPEGRIQKQTSVVAALDPEFVAALRQASSQSAASPLPGTDPD